MRTKLAQFFFRTSNYLCKATKEMFFSNEETFFYAYIPNLLKQLISFLHAVAHSFDSYLYKNLHEQCAANASKDTYSNLKFNSIYSFGWFFFCQETKIVTATNDTLNFNYYNEYRIIATRFICVFFLYIFNETFLVSFYK